MYAEGNRGFFNSVKTAFGDIKSAMSPAALKSDFVDPAVALADTGKVLSSNFKEASNKILGDLKGNSRKAGSAFLNDLRRVGRNSHDEEFKNYLIQRYGKEHAEEVLKKNTREAQRRVGKSIAKTAGLLTSAVDGGALLKSTSLGDMFADALGSISEGFDGFDELESGTKDVKGVKMMMKDYTPEERVDAHYRMGVNPLERLAQGLTAAKAAGIDGIGIGSGDHRAGLVPNEVISGLANFYADKRYGGKEGVDREVQARIATPEGQARLERYRRRDSVRGFLGKAGNKLQLFANKISPMFGGYDATAGMDPETTRQYLEAQRRAATSAAGQVVAKPYEMLGAAASEGYYYGVPAAKQAWNFISGLTKKKEEV